MRIHLLTKSAVQSRYLMLIIAAMTLPAVIVGSCLYYFIFSIMAEQLGIPESIAMNLTPVLNKVNFTLLVGLAPMFLVIFLWGLILSNRFAGPLTRIENNLDKVIKGDRSVRFRVREKDDMKAIADKLNKIIEKLK